MKHPKAIIIIIITIIIIIMITTSFHLFCSFNRPHAISEQVIEWPSLPAFIIHDWTIPTGANWENNLVLSYLSQFGMGHRQELTTLIPTERCRVCQTFHPPPSSLPPAHHPQAVSDASLNTNYDVAGPNGPHHGGWLAILITRMTQNLPRGAT